MTQHTQDGPARRIYEQRIDDMMFILQDWSKRDAQQLRNTLPIDDSCELLRNIRAVACKCEAPKTRQPLDCAKWTPWRDQVAPDAQAFLRKQSGPGPFVRTQDYVCEHCTHPVVTGEALIHHLGLARQRKNFSDRTLRRYLSASQPMPMFMLILISKFMPELMPKPTPIPMALLRTAFINAWALGWIGKKNGHAMARRINELEAVGRGLRIFSPYRPVARRKPSSLSMSRLMQEFDKQARLANADIDAEIYKRLQDPSLDPAQRKRLEDVRDERIRAQATKRQAASPPHPQSGSPSSS